MCKKRKISRSILRYRIMNSPAFITLLTWIIIIGILTIGAVVVFLLLTNIHGVYDVIALFSIPIVLRVFIPVNAYIDKILPKNRVCNVVRFILSIPIFASRLSNLIMPFLTIMATIIFMIAFSFLPVSFIVLGLDLLVYDISLNTKLFIFLTFPLIIASHGSSCIRKIILKYTPFNLNEHHFQVLMRELMKFLYTKENLHFIIYSAYFVFLTISSIKYLQSGGTIFGQEIDLIILKSFLVYIACTNMLDKKNHSNIEGKKLLSLLIKLILARDDEAWKESRKSNDEEDLL